MLFIKIDRMSVESGVWESEFGSFLASFIRMLGG